MRSSPQGVSTLSNHLHSILGPSRSKLVHFFILILRNFSYLRDWQRRQSFILRSCLAVRNWVGQKLQRNILSSYSLCAIKESVMLKKKKKKEDNCRHWKSFIIMFLFSVLKILTTNRVIITIILNCNKHCSSSLLKIDSHYYNFKSQ